MGKFNQLPDPFLIVVRSLFMKFQRMKAFGTLSCFPAGLLALTLVLGHPDRAVAAKPITAIVDSIVVEKKISNKKHRVKLYPDADHQVLFFSAGGDQQQSYQLYLIDINGKLIRQVNIKHKHTTLIKNIQKGNYQFEVFSNDERIEAGHESVT